MYSPEYLRMQPYLADFPESPSVEDRVRHVRAFSRDSLRNLILSLLYTGRLLVRTARLLDSRKEARARCVRGAGSCLDGIERNLWKLRQQTDLFNQFTADLERLKCEISALGESVPFSM
jgi:hypothetical protein